jgi:hypothetical protein
VGWVAPLLLMKHVMPELIRLEGGVRQGHIADSATSAREENLTWPKILSG